MAKLSGFRKGIGPTRYVEPGHGVALMRIFGKTGLRPIEARKVNVVFHGSPSWNQFITRVRARLAPHIGLTIGDLKKAARRPPK